MKEDQPTLKKHWLTKQQFKKTVATSACCLLLLAAASIVICSRLIENRAESKVYDEVAEIPYNKTALLLGTSPTLKNGNENLYYVYRIEAAVKLYRAGKVKQIIISGDHRKQNYNEPEEMKQALMKQSVPDSIIHLDYAGFRTLDSVVRAKEIFGQDSITVISQQFHNERAIFLAERHGIHAIGFNAENVSRYNGLKTTIREYLARVNVFLDIAIDKQPHFLGDKIEIE